MRKIFFFMFFAFSVFAVQETLANGKEEEHPVPVEIEKVRDAVVKILISGYVDGSYNGSFRENKQGAYNSVTPWHWAQRQGTGFVINEKIVVTSFHVLRKFESDIFFQIQNQSGEELSFKRITHLSVLDDLAVLEVEAYKGPFLTLNPLSNIEEFLRSRFCLLSFKVICDNVYIPAFPMGDFSEIEGEGFRINQLKDAYTLSTQFSGALSGASGGPVLNEQGEVIGILSGGTTNDYLFAIPVNILSALLQSPALPSAEEPKTLIREEMDYLRALFKQGNVRALRILNAWILSDLLNSKI